MHVTCIYVFIFIPTVSTVSRFAIVPLGKHIWARHPQFWGSLAVKICGSKALGRYLSLERSDIPYLEGTFEVDDFPNFPFGGRWDMLCTIPGKVDGRIANLNFFDSWRNPCICFCWMLIFFGKREPCFFRKNDRLPVFRRSIRMASFLFENRSRLWCEQSRAIWNWGYLKSLHNREGFKIPS